MYHFLKNKNRKGQSLLELILVVGAAALVITIVAPKVAEKYGNATDGVAVKMETAAGGLNLDGN